MNKGKLRRTLKAQQYQQRLAERQRKGYIASEFNPNTRRPLQPGERYSNSEGYTMIVSNGPIQKRYGPI